MFHYNEPVQDRQGNGLVGYFLGVVIPDPSNPQGGSPATIYADANGTPIVSVSGVANRAKVDENGMASFYVTEGSYHVDLYGPDGTTNLNRFYDIPMLSAAVSTTSPASVGTRALMAAVSGPVSTQSIYLSEAGREGTFTFSTANHSAHVTADTQQGVYVAPSSDTTGASGAWVRKFSGPADIRWFGAVADCTSAGTGTDNAPMFNAARAALTAHGAGWLHIPQQSAAYRFATAPGEIHDGIRITGDGWHENPGTVGVNTYVGIQVYSGTVLCFDADTRGFQFIAYTDNAANATAFEYQSATYSTIENIMLYSAGGVGTTSHGIETRTVITARNVRVVGFAGNGFQIYGWTGAVSQNYGLTDLSGFYSCQSNQNKLHGWYVAGDDANVITFSNCNSTLNGGAGWLDVSFLGNNYLGCQCATNNQSHPSNNPSAFSTAQRTYVTDTTGGAQLQTGHVGLGTSTIGSYLTTQSAAAHTFLGCYTESGEGQKAVFAVASMSFGGNLASSGSIDTSSLGSVYNGPNINNIATITSDTSGVVSVTGNWNVSGVYRIGATQVLGARSTGWTADTGTAEKTSHATYTAGTTLTYSASYVQSEQTAMATRMASVEAALQSVTRGQKAIKDALLNHGMLGA